MNRWRNACGDAAWEIAQPDLSPRSSRSALTTSELNCSSSISPSLSALGQPRRRAPQILTGVTRSGARLSSSSYRTRTARLHAIIGFRPPVAPLAHDPHDQTGQFNLLHNTPTYNLHRHWVRNSIFVYPRSRLIRMQCALTMTTSPF